MPSSSKDETSKSICCVELNMPSIAKNKRIWLLWSLIFHFHILHNRSSPFFSDFLAGILAFLACWLTGTNECCVYPTAFWSFADVTHEQISIMRAQEMFKPPFVQFHTLYEMSVLASHLSETWAKTTRTWALPVLFIQGTTKKQTFFHQWPVQTSRDLFGPFFPPLPVLHRFRHISQTVLE